MTQRALFISILFVLLQLAGVQARLGFAGTTAPDAGNYIPYSESRREILLIASRDENERDDRGEDDEDEVRGYRKCRHGRSHKPCGHRELKVKMVRDLNFGRVVGDAQQGGTVVIHADTGSKTVTRLYDGGGAHSRAEFEIHGQPNKQFAVMLPPEVVLAASGNSKVERFTIFPSSSGTFGPDGKARVFVGATLALGPHRQGGEGSAPVSIYVDYLR